VNNGFIKLFRCIEDSFFWNDSQAVHLWIQLLLSANHRDKEMLLSGEKVIIKSGHFVCSRNTLSLKTGINESKVHRILKVFESEQMIEQQMNSKYRMISISNWNKYQGSEQVSEQQMNSRRTADEQQMNTNNNDKNDKNDKNKTKDTGDKSPDDFENAWTLYQKKGNRKTSLAKWIKLSNDQKALALQKIPAYVKSTPDSKFRKNFESWINQECWNDEILTNKTIFDVGNNAEEQKSELERAVQRKLEENRRIAEEYEDDGTEIF
jgi:hypothetical protein